VSDSLAGSYQSVFKGSGMHFDEVREYVPGDEIRTIDWNVTARTGSPHVKKFIEERELTIMLLIDISASGNFGSSVGSKRELMAELGAVLAFSAINSSDKVGLLLFSDFIELYIPPNRGRSHILRLIREILYYRPRGKKTDLLLPLDFVTKICKQKSVVFLISDYLIGDNSDSGLAALKKKMSVINRRHDLISVIVSDPREQDLINCGLITIEDGETGEQVEINSADPLIRAGWHDLAQQRRLRLLQAIRGTGVDTLELSTERSYLEPLLNFFGARRRRLAR